MIRVTLTDDEQALARRVGRARFESNRDHGIRDAKVGGQAHDFVDVNGFGGEIAFCKVMGLEPDIAIIPGGGENLADAVLPDGRRVDVKTSHYASANLVARKIQADVDLFVLVRGRLPHYEVVGYAERAALVAAPKRELVSGRPTYFLSAARLRPIEELKQ